MKKIVISLISIVFILSILFMGIGCKTGETAKAEESEGWTIGFVGYPPIWAWTAATLTMNSWYAEDNGIKLKSAYDGEFSGQESIKGGRQLLESGIDALIIEAVSTKVLKTLSDEATKAGVPVFSYNAPFDSADCKMFVGVSQFELGSTASNYVKELLVEKYGEAKGTVLIVHGDPASLTYVARELGYASAFENEPNITIEDIQVPSMTEDDTVAAVSTWLATGKEFDAAWAPSGGANLALVEALKKNGKDPKDYILIGSDAYPNTLNFIRLGEMKGSTDQPVPYYGPITIKYIVDYLEGRELPSVGTTITFKEEGPFAVNEINIEGNERLGVNPWQYDEEVYLPAEIVDWKSAITPGESELYDYTFPWFKTKVALVTPENVDSLSLWGNFPVDWDKASKTLK